MFTRNSYTYCLWFINSSSATASNSPFIGLSSSKFFKFSIFYKIYCYFSWNLLIQADPVPELYKALLSLYLSLSLEDLMIFLDWSSCWTAELTCFLLAMMYLALF